MKENIVDFIIIGAQKGGTTSAAYNLNLHPDIEIFNGLTKFNQREIEFFNQHWTEGLDWYKSHFNYSKMLTGEKTAELLHRTICHERMKKVIPNAKLLILLRCPIERAFSQWKMASKPNWNEKRSFEEIVWQEINSIRSKDYIDKFNKCANNNLVDSWREGYLLKGLYVLQIKHLYEYFPKENIHISISERVRNNMKTEYNRIFNFLGLNGFNGDFHEKFVSSSKTEMSFIIRNELINFYKPFTSELYKLLGYSIPEWE